MNGNRKIRVLMAKGGLDGHDRGIRVIISGLRNEGFEVIYSGLRQQPEGIVATAIQEDVDVVGLSTLSGAHNYLLPRVVELLSEKGITDVMVIGGGRIPEEDIPFLLSKGVKAIFGPSSTIKSIADYIRVNVRK